MRHKIAWVALAVAGLMLGLLLHGTSRTSSQYDAAILGSGADRLPSETLADWVTYADHVAIVSASAEQETDLTANEKAVGEGLTGRDVQFTIDSVLWDRPGSQQLPKVLVMPSPGWVYKDNERFEFALRGAPRVEVGHTYLMPLVLITTEDIGPRQEWSPLSQTSSIFPMDGGLVGQGDAVRGKGLDGMSEAANTLWGMSRSQVAAALTASDPLPAAMPFMTLDPLSRYARIAAKSDK